MSDNQTPAPRRRFARTLFMGAAIVGAFASAGVLAASRPAQALAAAMHGGPGHMQSGLHGMGGGMHMHAAAHIDAMLAKAEATEEQKVRIHAIMRQAMTSLSPLHGRFQQSHGELHAILTAPRVDRAALERLRAARMADVDQASRVLAKALADSAEVLTPEQRAKLGAEMGGDGTGTRPHG